MVKTKRFKTPSEKPARAISDDFRHIVHITAAWTEVREECWQSAYSEGCVSEDMIVRGMSQEQTLAAIKAENIQAETAIKDAIQYLISEGDPSKLNMDGTPKTTAVGDIVGTTPTRKQLKKLYLEVA